MLFSSRKTKPNQNCFLVSCISLCALITLLCLPAATALADNSDETPNRLIESNLIKSELQISDCSQLYRLKGERYICGFLAVPENYTNQNSNIIRIPFLVVMPDEHLFDKTLQPLLVTGGGGPGNALLGNQYYRIVDDEFWTYEEMSVADGRPLMILENRGAGLSQPNLDCDYQPEIFQHNFWTELLKMDFTCGEKYLSAGIDLSQYNVRNAALDIEMFRALYEQRAASTKQLNLYGISYGTRVAMYYERLFPDKARTMVLDSVAMTVKDSLDEELEYAQRSLDLVFSKCRTDKLCRERFGSALESRLYQYLTEVDNKDITLDISWPGRTQTLSVPLTGSLIVNVLHDALYSNETIAAIPLTVSSMINGSNDRIAAGVTDHIHGYSSQYAFSDTAFITYLCFDEDYSNSSQEDLSSLKLYQYWDLNQGRNYMHRVCSNYGLAFNQSLSLNRYLSDTPVLLLSGELDPVTPPATANQAADNFSYHWNSVQANVSHDVITHSSCARFLASWFIYHPQEDLDSRVNDCEPEATSIPFLLE